ncbi:MULTISPECIES: hypothetical protein [Curtobacterium]|uniref:Rax2 family protein n=1 Tax=Curtobacterium citreum TaxID=2036 RepID=A0ABT2HGZ6_9MICO|nr:MULTISPECIES: hypothetical protein [Curtobacterium]MCS6522542.1 Rax2 family protein [Curtobacterium citreum]RDI01027.1 hypothetical protein DEU32_10255 [Curtobacterium sp. AG1037]TQJ26292.1 hypothetical protein FB462_0117 [Curtobacterium citreum]
MVVIGIVIGVAVAIAALLVVLELQNVRRRRTLAHLEPVDPRIGERAMSQASAAHAIVEGQAKSAHPGISGAGGGPLG